MSAHAMEQLYQQVILDHSRSPHGRGLVDQAAGELTGESHQINPTCGDEVRLRAHLQVEPDVSGTAGAGLRVRAVSWEGQGCSISQASLSMLSDMVAGADLAAVDELVETFLALMHSRGAGLDETREDLLGEATAFTGVSRYPARVKCALLGWMALRDAVAQAAAQQASTAQQSSTTDSGASA